MKNLEIGRSYVVKTRYRKMYHVLVSSLKREAQLKNLAITIIDSATGAVIKDSDKNPFNEIQSMLQRLAGMPIITVEEFFEISANKTNSNSPETHTKSP